MSRTTKRTTGVKAQANTAPVATTKPKASVASEVANEKQVSQVVKNNLTQVTPNFFARRRVWPD